ncbi:hypothetical protein HMF8227_02201 [Saliniradius amylolyticus]|uniref:Lon N-terminal domain-containing protein n=1 Tax=Saliniradius amylolyticus TaxID=2183582 RepID=A0A2S2E4S6_9ALTE|nr:LON peptidase substrate-binding domain-containing protein [Saliniradius amylolyticus]AWL12654.1 hypothetical protein HMF8227_02201 [Saliniradius amylolyticus]
MSEKSISIPLFPLSSHVLPGGRLSLRIFEPRYLRMVKEACRQNSGFGICMLKQGLTGSERCPILPIGTYVNVVDFDMLRDGMLGITVEGQRLFHMEQFTTQSDGLRIGQCHWLDMWQANLPEESINPLVKKLKQTFSRYRELAELYEQPRFDDPQWVVSRWLELLPVDAEQKQWLLGQQDSGKVVDFLTQLTH